jgi:hypothetical protein
MIHPITMILICCFATSCLTAQDYFEQHESDRASFDLDCPKERLKIRSLKETRICEDAKVGVEGCGRRAMYICVINDGHAKWIRN